MYEIKAQQLWEDRFHTLEHREEGSAAEEKLWPISPNIVAIDSEGRTSGRNA